jgi:hypothetical protein
MAERSMAAVLKTEQGPISTSRIAPNLTFPAENLPIAIPS